MDEETVVEEVVVDEVEKAPKIDLDKFDKNKDSKKEDKGESIESLKAELEKERLAKAKFKKSFDNKASEAAKLTAQLRETEKEAVEPIEKLTAMEIKLAEYELNEKRTNLTYGLTEKLGIGKDMAQELVSAAYDSDTGEFSVGDFENALVKLVDSVRDSSYQKGYEIRDAEFNSGKPRSLGGEKNQSAADIKKAEYLKSVGR